MKKTDNEIREAVVGSVTYAGILTKLGLVPMGGNYKTIKRRIRILGISTEHLKGKSWNRGGVGKRSYAKKSLESIMIEDSSYSTFKLKKRLFREGIFNKKCNKCGGEQWLGKSMPLELEHKNGNSHDHRIENLEILCPNCHSFTDTYRGRKSRGKKIIKEERICSNCNGRVSLRSKSGLCYLCSPKF
jgi:Zn finger protein HypA/HybF involved in hydrogenase expression